MNTPRVISLDLDDTLWPIAPVISVAEAELMAWLRARHPQVVDGHDVNSMRELRLSVAARFPDRSHDMTFLRRQALAEQFAASGQPLSDACVEEAMEVFFLGRNRVQFYDDVLPALVRLRRKYRLFAVSNGNASLKRCGIEDLFDGHVTAAGVGAAKPDARIFAHLLREARVEAVEVLHIGDDPLADVVGATQAGMQAVWLNRDAKIWPSQFSPPLRTVATLAEID